MLTRIVKMVFKPEFTKDFINLFIEKQPLIAASKGCMEVSHFKDLNNDCVFFTISRWENESDLEAYRQSDLFKTTWAEVKPNFTEKAQAFSLINV